MVHNIIIEEAEILTKINNGQSTLEHQLKLVNENEEGYNLLDRLVLFLSNLTRSKHVKENTAEFITNEQSIYVSVIDEFKEASDIQEIDSKSIADFIVYEHIIQNETVVNAEEKLRMLEEINIPRHTVTRNIEKNYLCCKLHILLNMPILNMIKISETNEKLKELI